MATKTSRLQFRIDPELKAWFAEFANKSQEKMSDIVVAHLQELRLREGTEAPGGSARARPE